MTRPFVLMTAFVAVFLTGKSLPLPTISGSSTWTRSSWWASADDSSRPHYYGTWDRFAAGPADDPSSPANEPPGRKTTDALPTNDESGALSVPGLVVAARRIAVRVPVSGILGSLTVDEGDSVKMGQIVAKIDDTEIDAECKCQEATVAATKNLVQEAQSRFDLARYQLDIRQRLFARRAVSEMALRENEFRVTSTTTKLEAMKNQVIAEEHQLAMLRRKKEKHRVIAPFVGMVTELLQYPNQYVREGDLILWVESYEKQLKLHLPYELAEHPDQVAFSLATDGRQIRKKVCRLKPEYNPDGSRTVFLELPADRGLLPGQILQVHLRDRKKQLFQFQPVHVILRELQRLKDLPYVKRILRSLGLPQNDTAYTAFGKVIFARALNRRRDNP
ncbi:MAG: efflux RND transporter periplasmic adaptor subunit [Rhodothermia bacterium]